MKNLWRNFFAVCLKCHWNGKVSDLKFGESVLGGEDSPCPMLCPKCNENLAIRSRTDIRAIAGKGIVKGGE